MRDQFFTFIRECGKILGKNDEETSKLLDDQSWFYCFDDGMTPQETVGMYLRYVRESGSTMPFTLEERVRLGLVVRLGDTWVEREK